MVKGKQNVKGKNFGSKPLAVESELLMREA